MADKILRHEGMHSQSPNLGPLPLEDVNVHDYKVSAKQDVVNPFQKDTLTVDPGKPKPLGSQVLAPQGWYPYETTAVAPQATKEATAAVGQVATSVSSPRLSVFERIKSWWSGAEAEASTESPSEPIPVTPVAAPTQEPTQTSYYEGLRQWAGSVWNYLASFSGGATPPVAIDGTTNSPGAASSNVPIPLSPQERAELRKLMQTFNKLMNRIKETLSEAELEELMETILMIAHHNKTDLFNLEKSTLIKKHEFLKDEQLKRMKALEEFMAQQKWGNEVGGGLGWAEEIANSIGFVFGATMTANPTWQALAALYVVGKTLDKYHDYPAEHGLAQLVTWLRVGDLFGAKPAETKQTAFACIRNGFEIGTLIVSLQLKVGISAWSSFLKGSVRIVQAKVQEKTDSKRGTLEHQGFTTQRAKDDLSAQQNELSLAHRGSMRMWKSLLRFAQANHSAKRSMIQ